jgi:hypothetical protein
MYTVIFIILIVILLYLNNIIFNEFFQNNNNINILTKEDLIKILLINKDGYYQNFNKYDLQVRNVTSISEYKEVIINSPITINFNSNNKIIKTINKIDNFFKNYKTIGFDGNKASKIKWNIGIIDGNFYEGGFPHTRSNVIIIPNNIIFKDDLQKILIHEKIHIYQKEYSKDVEIFLNHYEFKKYNKHIKFDNIRANPDIDNNIYIDKNNNFLLSLYNKNPKNIMDVTYYPNNNPIYEHPFEYMAYIIEDDINKKIKNIEKDI